MKYIEKKNLSGKTRNLLLVSFFTLTLAVAAFLVAVTALDRSSKDIFNAVQSSVQSNIRGTDLYRMLVALELDIRDLIHIVMREPYKLTSAKESLKEQFEQIEQTAYQGENSPLQQKLLRQLRWYRSSLDRLLWDYGEVNSVLYEVYFYINNVKEQLTYMEEAAGKILVDRALEGRNSDAIQQSYVLVNIAREKILQAHVLVDASVSNNNLRLLVVDKENKNEGETDTALDKINSLDNTLRTLTASEEAIAGYAGTVQQTLPLLQDNIVDLWVKYSSLNEHYRLFMVERNNSMKLLDDLEKENRSRILSVNQHMTRHSRTTMLVAWLVSLAVLVISAIGLVLTRNMSRQLEQLAAEALLAREAGETLNTQLQQEIVERRRIADDLEQAREELEKRVRERTAALSMANKGLALEIDERKSAEYDLASEKERLTVTLRSIGDGVITTDIDSRVVLLNKVAEELTGWQQSDAAGKPLSEVFHIICRHTGDSCENPVEILLRDGKIHNLPEGTILVSRDGSERLIADSCAAIRDMNSNIIGAVLVFRDESERRKMQEEALKSEKLKSVGVLAGGIAHDFNNILAAILGNISLVKLQVDQESDAKTWKLLEGAEKASLRARSLTQQLLTFSKGGDPVKKLESISEIIKDSAEFILSGGKVFCEYTIEEDLWPVNIDAGQISQVIQNIIINAMHAMPGGGRIDIACTNFSNEERRIPSLQDGSYVRISIKDQGEGIPKELLDRIFDPYFTTKEEGSGLGLTLTHSIVSKHHGHIEVETGPRGTDFIIFLPAMPGRKIEEKSARVKIVNGHTRARVLIMDDEVMVREIAKDLLVHLGFEVTTAINGEEAVYLYQSMRDSGKPFDVVIMDLTIPGGMGGKDTMRKLQEIDPGVMGIVSSGYSNDPVMAEYEKYGFAGMVHKPFEVDELVETLYRVIEQGRAS